MSKKLKRINSIILALTMMVSLCMQGMTANAAPDPGGDPPGGTGGGPGGGGDSSYPTFDDVKGAAAILINGDTASTINDSTSASTFGGKLSVASGGSVTADSISGVSIVGADYSGATEDTNTDNGIVINKNSSSDIVHVGNATNFYSVDVDGNGTMKSFNSTIILKNEETVDDAKEGNDGVGLILGTGGTVVDNVYIKTDGMRSPALYNMKADSVVVVKNSWLETNGGKSWHPVFTMLTASTRAALLFGGETWFYNDNIITQDWGCLSQEGNNSGTKTYSINSYLEAYKGGYGAYVSFFSSYSYPFL